MKTTNVPIVKIKCVKKVNGHVVEVHAKEKISFFRSRTIIITPTSTSYRFKSKDGLAIIANDTATNPISLISIAKDMHNLLDDFPECNN